MRLVRSLCRWSAGDMTEHRAWRCQPRLLVGEHLVGDDRYLELCTTPCLKKTSHLWLAITLMHVNGFWYFFGRNVTDEVGNQKTLYYATSNNLCFCTTWQNGETWKSHISLNWIVLHTHCTCALSSWKKRLSPVMHLTFVEIVRYPINTIHRLLLQAWRRTTPTFCTATDSVTDMANTEHVGNSRMLCSLPRSCLVHAIDHFDSKGWFSSDQVIL